MPATKIFRQCNLIQFQSILMVAAEAFHNMQLLTKSSINAVNLQRWVSLRLLILILVSANVAFCASIVKYLPGFDGELPFKLETGYISVEDSELFYYFIKSQGNPKEDPLFLWLTGGPGCSSFHAFVYEIGPLEFDINTYTGSLPRLINYTYAWTKTASIIFLDAPVGTGFSYSTTQEGWPTSDSKSAEQSYQFLRKWLDEHPQYLPVQLFIGGVAAKVKPRMNLKGYLIGCPRTDSIIDENSKIVFAHRMALISDELYEQLKTSCNEDYVNVDPSNTACVMALAYYQKCIEDLYTYNILEPTCAYASPKQNAELDRRSLQQNPTDFILSPPRIPEEWCRNFNYALSYMWANDERVQEALHVRQGHVLDWKRCNKSLSYTKDIPSVVDVHRYLSQFGLQVLVQSGDRDIVVPFVGTVKWIKSLNLTVVNDWRPWFVDGQIAGYTRKYSENGFRLTYATVKGAGHTATEYYRRECYNMFKRDRWLLVLENYRLIGRLSVKGPLEGLSVNNSELSTTSLNPKETLKKTLFFYGSLEALAALLSLELSMKLGAGHTAPEYYRRECYIMFKRWVHYYPL